MSSTSRHIENVLKTATHPAAAARSRLAASWRRSLDHHGLDPGERGEVQRITETALHERRDRSADMLRVATPKIDALFQMVSRSGCGVLLTDADGVVLDLRASDADRAAFNRWGLALGSDWS